ncbi:hypothetical protein CLU82_1561 [Flavobacterium sp. 5]|nr:hypothetical protein CLU82_1561 [Flavobacterium sp. 5]
MNGIFKNIFALLLLIPSVYAQKSQIKEAQKELKAGNSEQALAILSPVEYLISNAPVDDRIHFYYVQATALVNLANNNINSAKNLSKAILALTDLIQVESESNDIKYSTEAVEMLYRIKNNLVVSAKNDLAAENFAESSNKFYQAYLIDKKDTLQLYNAAMSYKNGDDIDSALKCFEELKTIKYNGNIAVFIAYNKKLLVDEYFPTIEERDTKIQSGSHMRPNVKFYSKRGEISKNIALIYVQKGFKEKAIKAIEMAKKFNGIDESLNVVEANLYLETKDYETFDHLATFILELNNKNAQLASDFGINCEKELYYEGAEYYYKKAISMDPLYAASYIKLSALLIGKGNAIDSNIKSLETTEANKKMIAELKLQKEQILKSVQTYLQKVVNIDPFNNNAKELMASINITTNVKSKAFASGE